MEEDLAEMEDQPCPIVNLEAEEPKPLEQSNQISKIVNDEEHKEAFDFDIDLDDINQSEDEDEHEEEAAESQPLKTT
jgi:hypothetical protein